MANVPTITGAVRITIPAVVASNIKTLKTSLLSIAERLGCKPCFSGADCFFQLEKEYIIDENAKVFGSSLRVDNKGLATHSAFSTATSGRTINVSLSPKAGFSIDTISAAIGKIAELSGHTACATGCNIFFQHFLDDMRSFAVNDKGAINQF